MQRKVNCTTCGKEFFLSEWSYNYRLKRNKGRGVFCSNRCGALGNTPSQETRDKLKVSQRKSYDEGRRNLSPMVTVECLRCKKPITMKRWAYNHKIKKSKRDGLFCSLECSLIGHVTPQETRNKISKSQIGISVLSRGRVGHLVSEATRKKLSQSRIGKHIQTDWDIVDRDLKERGIIKSAITKTVVPDSIFIDKDGLLVAYEVEKKTWENEAKRKMLKYKDMNGYDKIIIVWYSRGVKKKEWSKTKNDFEWKEISFI